MPDSIRMAIVGCGAIAQSHAEAILASDSVELVGACDLDEAARERAAARWDCTVASSIGELVDRTAPDAVCLCTPPSHHRVGTESLLEAGLHILCEKPVATASADVSTMLDAARRAGRVLMTSAKFRYVDDLVEAGELLRDGAVGEPRIFEVAFCSPVPMADRWNSDPALSGGGVVMDNAYHALDVLWHVSKSPITWLTAAFPGPTTPGLDVEDVAEILFRTTAGRAGRISLSWSHWTRDLDYLIVHGSEGSLRVGWTGGHVRRNDERTWTSFGKGYDKGASFLAQLEVFVERIRHPGQTHGDPLVNARFVEAVYAAARSESHSAVPIR